MKAAPERERQGWGRYFNTTTLGVVFLVGAFSVSIGRVLRNQQELFDPTVKTIRLAHWQLELGFRGALQEVIDEYNRLHAESRVRVVQMPVTEKVYPQWLNTHLISGTAPDLIQLGMAKMASDSEYVAKFFLPLGELVHDPNPYNAGTSLEGEPWRETFYDGMAAGYRSDLQEFYGAPMVLWNMRLFYNRALLQQATGRSEPPQTFGELLAACTALRQLQTPRGKAIIPIAGSKYSLAYFQNALNTPFFAAYESALDTDIDSHVSSLEALSGYEQGKWSFAEPRVQGYFDCLQALADQFSTGFMAMERDQAAFLFVQGHAAMIASGSWDAQSLFQQAAFEVGVMDFPLPAQGERWGEFITGRRNEASGSSGATFAVNRRSAHPDWALDFMKYLSSQKINERFNQRADWLPSVIGARPNAHMRAFMPNPVGYSTGLPLAGADRISSVLDGQLWLFLQGETGYPELRRQMEQQLADPQTGIQSFWARAYDEGWRRARTTERFLAAQSALLALDEGSPAAKLKYHGNLWQQVRGNNAGGIRQRYEQTYHRPIPPR